MPRKSARPVADHKRVSRGSQKENTLQILTKLDGVGPVDNRPSTNKLHHFFQKKKKKKM